MNHSPKLRLSVVLVLVASAAITLVATASGSGQLFRESIDETEIFVEEDFCGVEGLTVEFTRHTVGRVHAVPHGEDGLVYFGFNLKVTEVVTFTEKTASCTSAST